MIDALDIFALVVFGVLSEQRRSAATGSMPRWRGRRSGRRGGVKRASVVSTCARKPKSSAR